MHACRSTLEDPTYAASSGAGVYVESGTTTISNATFSANNGSGIVNQTGTVTLRNTIVSGSTAANCSGTIGGSNNLQFGGATCGASFATAGSQPLDTTLRDNGGLTRTHKLVPGSQAIDAGDPSGCIDTDDTTPLTADQRGVTRPQSAGGRCDIGAVEMRPPVLDLNGLAAGVGYAASFSQGGSAVAVVDASALSVTQPDQAALTGATITLAGRPDGISESLAVSTAGTSITAAAYDPGSGTLTLANGATPAQYQQVLRTLTYANSASLPTAGARTVTIVVRDADGATGALTAQAGTTVNVTPANDPPVAVDDSYSVGAGQTLTVPPATGVLANDTDVDTVATSLTTVLVTSPAHGTLTLSPNGGFAYVPAAGFAGTDTFTYRASDGAASSSPATVTITVVASQCAPRSTVSVTTAAVNGKLAATVTAISPGPQTSGRLIELRFGELKNGKVSVEGQQVASGVTVQLPPNTSTTTLVVERTTAGQATTVPFTVVDACGEWPSFVGGGPTAF